MTPPSLRAPSPRYGARRCWAGAVERVPEQGRLPPTFSDEGIQAAAKARRRVPGLPVMVLSASVEQAFTTEVLERLTDSERRVLALMAEGLGNRAIAARLVVTEAAVLKHVRAIFAKLDLPPSDEQDRRVAAVLEYLRAAGRWPLAAERSGDLVAEAGTVALALPQEWSRRD